MSASAPVASAAPSGRIARIWEHRPPVLIVACAAFVAAVAICSVVGGLIAPADPSAQRLDEVLLTPGGGHLLGTDELGRDIFSRVIVGARTALVGPALVALGSMAIGGSLGLLAGYAGGRVEGAVMRWVDLMYALPALLVAIVVMGTVGGGYALAVVLLIVLTAPSDARVIRGAVLEQRPRAYVDAARTLGLSPARITYRHIVPNVLPVAITNMFVIFAYALVALSGLSFLGLGVQPGTADWGRMLSENRASVFINPAAALAPAVLIVTTAGAMSFLGDWAGERLSVTRRTR